MKKDTTIERERERNRKKNRERERDCVCARECARKKKRKTEIYIFFMYFNIIFLTKFQLPFLLQSIFSILKSRSSISFVLISPFPQITILF